MLAQHVLTEREMLGGTIRLHLQLDQPLPALPAGVNLHLKIEAAQVVVTGLRPLPKIRIPAGTLIK